MNVFSSSNVHRERAISSTIAGHRGDGVSWLSVGVLILRTAIDLPFAIGVNRWGTDCSTSSNEGDRDDRTRVRTRSSDSPAALSLSECGAGYRNNVDVADRNDRDRNAVASGQTSAIGHRCRDGMCARTE